MKKYLFLFFVLFFVSLSAGADDISDSMEAALATHSDSLNLQEDMPESLSPMSDDIVVSKVPVVAPSSVPAVTAASSNGSTESKAEVTVSDALPESVKEEPAAVPEVSPSEPVKARDVLPEMPAASDDLEQVVLDEEGNEVTAKDLVLEEAAKAGKLMLADFDAGEKPNNLGGDYGGWDKDPSDDTQTCRATHASDDSTGNLEGFALRLDYDVDSPKPAYNGFWMKLENVNALPYDTLSLDVRGASHRFTKRLKIELKTPDSRSSSFFVSGITDQWQTIQVPLKRFKGIKDWSILSEMILVFDDVNTAPKKGTLLVDQIRLERLEGGMPQKNMSDGKTGYFLSEDKEPEELINRPS